MSIIKLGQEARDVTTGFAGTITQRLDQINGNVQWCLQPKMGKDGVFKDAMFLDAHHLDVVGPGLSDKVTEVTDPVDFALGNEVKDLSSGFVGIVIEKATYMNGCMSFRVVPKYDPKSAFNGSAPEGSWISSKLLTYKGPGIVAKLRKPVPAASGRIPGGPPQRVARPIARRA
jgi:hypothetical protein